MNDVMRRVLGKPLTEDDVVPVLANLPRKFFHDRQRPQSSDRQRPQSALRRTIGEAEGDVIPADAQDIEDKDVATLTTRLRPVKDVVQEPSYPAGEKEKYLSPYAALTAPDITPKSMTPNDPSSLPGVKANTFRAKDIAEPESAAEIQAPNDNVDKATRAMDVILGRQRTGAPAQNKNEFAAAGQVTTEAQAAAMLGLSAGPSGAALLGQGKEMAAPTQGDGKAIYETARRFI